MKYKALLFDIDGTLIWSGYAGGRALERTFNELYGIKNCMRGVRPDGMTDPQIVKEIFRKNVGKEPDKKDVEVVFKKYLEHLKITVWNPDYRVMEGAVELLKELKKREGFIIGLATGNIYEGAKLKLMPSGLWGYFEFGGFSTDSEIREEILLIAKKRAEEKIGSKGMIGKVIVIGDTHLDIIAAKKAGFVSIAVATGNFPVWKLKEYSPDYVFESFREYNKIIKIMEEI